MNRISSELPFHVHNCLIISLKDFCIVIRKWLTFWPSKFIIALDLEVSFYLMPCQNKLEIYHVLFQVLNIN